MPSGWGLCVPLSITQKTRTWIFKHARSAVKTSRLLFDLTGATPPIRYLSMINPTRTCLPATPTQSCGGGGSRRIFMSLAFPTETRDLQLTGACWPGCNPSNRGRCQRSPDHGLHEQRRKTAAEDPSVKLAEHRRVHVHLGSKGQGRRVCPAERGRSACCCSAAVTTQAAHTLFFTRQPGCNHSPKEQQHTSEGDTTTQPVRGDNSNTHSRRCHGELVVVVVAFFANRRKNSERVERTTNADKILR